MLSGAAILTLNDGLIKGLAETYPTGELLFIRGVFVWPWILVFAFRSGGLVSLRINNLRGQALRGVCVIASAFFFINGLRHLTLADAIAVAFTGPLFITAMAPLMLGERVGWRRWAAVLVGFAGVIFMLRPGGDVLQWAIIFPLGAAIFGGMRDLITRQIAGTETTVAVLAVTVRLYLTSFGSLQELWGPLLWTMAALTILWGNLAAIAQTKVKRMLAYSSIAHVGYLLIAMAAVFAN